MRKMTKPQQQRYLSYQFDKREEKECYYMRELLFKNCGSLYLVGQTAKDYKAGDIIKVNNMICDLKVVEADSKKIIAVMI